MKIYFWKTWFIGFVCISFTLQTSASKTNGYIIDNDKDTIYGIFKLRNMNPTGALLINGFDRESLHSRVVFKKEGESSYKILLPDMIKEFHFTYDSIGYSYRSFLVTYTSLSYNDKSKQRFLRLLHEGNIDLYEDIVITEKTNGSFAGERTHYYEYFMGLDNLSLTRVKMDNKTPNLKAVLRQLLVDEDFLNRISDIATIKDLPVILQEYDFWLQ